MGHPETPDRRRLPARHGTSRPEVRAGQDAAVVIRGDGAAGSRIGAVL